MKSKRGLTLLETLLAAAMLAILAAAVAPIFQDALRAIETDDSVVELSELASLADTVLAEPSAFGFESAEEITRTELTWPDNPERPSVSVNSFPGGAPDHIWLVFTCDGVFVSRWIAVEEKTEETP